MPFHGLKNEQGETIKLKEVPETYDEKVHRPLRKENFEGDDWYYIHKAEQLEAQAQWNRKQAEDYRKLGGVQDRAKAKRLLDMQSRMAELKAQLAADGVDVEALMGGNAVANAPAEQPAG